MILYHYTSKHHLPRIQAAGVLLPSESNIGSPWPDVLPYGEHIGPDVVWLTELADVKAGHGLEGSAVNKFEVKITVDINDAVKWSEFAASYNINKRWYRALDKSAGWSAKHWWVVPRKISATEFINVEIIK